MTELNNILDLITKDMELPKGYDRWLIRSVHPDFTSFNGFRWPFPGRAARASNPIRSNTNPCPQRDGDGLCAATTWRGMASGGIPATTLLLVAVKNSDILSDETESQHTEKYRFAAAKVVELIDGSRIVRTLGRRANLREADLQRANLREADLQRANLWGANLEGADLRWAHLEGADLGGARLEAAYLWGALLEGADLRGANLRGANLEGADLEGADLEGADLGGANLQGANLRGADLEAAYLGGANLRGAGLEGALLQWADLEGANLRGANLQGASGLPENPIEHGIIL